MGKSLVIVESPAKARTINRYLGKDFRVESSVGHVRDLPASGSGKRAVAARGRAAAAGKPEQTPEQKAWNALVRRMGVDPKHGWKADYQILPNKQKTVDTLRRLAKDADVVYLATDLDREGEAIAWHLREVLGSDPEKYRRAVFNEITKKAVTAAFQQPTTLNLNRVNAQQARRFLDRVVGYMLSPLLWEKVARGLSAGRVQSVALRLVTEREREISAFQSEEYWNVFADMRTAGQAPITLQVSKHRGKKFRPGSADAVDTALAALRAGDYAVSDRQERSASAKPPPPLITSTLQQAAYNRLGFGVKQTMAVAQRLYEAGHITYMRTDSTHLGADAIAACRAQIQAAYGADYLPEKPNRYTSKADAQEAHEAIRPSDVAVAPEHLVKAKPQDVRLYALIWRHFIACQMTPLRYTTVSLLAAADDYELKATGRRLDFDGFSRVLERASDDVMLPDTQVGDPLSLLDLRAEQHFTQPPARYNEASLVRELEKRGVGRPSTYASIISTICDRGYVRIDSRRLYAEKIGMLVVDRLRHSFGDLMDYGFTAAMEGDLDKVANGAMDWHELLDRFFADFDRQLKTAAAAEGMPPNLPVPVPGLQCPDCGRDMVARTAATGMFLGCTGYQLPPAERCGRTIDLSPALPVASADAQAAEQEANDAKLAREQRRCPRCGSAMEAFPVDSSHRLHLCADCPNCPGAEVEIGEFQRAGDDVETMECNRCGGVMERRSGRYGQYFSCTGSDCGNTRKVLADGQVAPPRVAPLPMPELRCARVDDHFVLRDGAAGLFLSASQFPRHRETRAPLVSELLPHREKLDEKFAHLCAAPTEDPEGRPAVVRFDRKTGEHYVRSERDGKPSGWLSVCRQGQWQVDPDAMRPASRKAPAARRPRKTPARTTSKPRPR